MKKFAVGCLVALGLFMVVGGVGLYFAYERLFRPGMEMAASVTELAKVADIEKDVRNTVAFEAPQGGDLTQAMVERFIKVQQHVEEALGPKMSELKARHEEIDRLFAGEKRQASLREVATGVKDLTAIVLLAKKAQVEALNAADFSVSEYQWVRQQVYAAIGVVAVGLDVKKIAKEAQAGNVEALSGKRERERTVLVVSEHNKTLVAPYERQLKEWAPLAFFGL